MGDADIPARENKVLNILGDHSSKRQLPRLRSRMEDGGVALCIIESLGEMVVHGPAGVSHQIVEMAFRFHVVLCDGIFSHIAAAFSFAGQKSDPFQFPVLGTVVAMIFHVVPNSQTNFQKLITASVSVMDAVPFTA